MCCVEIDCGGIESKVNFSRAISKADTVIMVNMFSPSEPISPAYDKDKCAVLIVCYLRPEALRKNLQILCGTRRRIYVFIDFCDEQVWSETNNQVLRVAESFKSKLDIKITHTKMNFGVAKALPAAVDWIFQFEDSAIILEDDCICNEWGYEYLDDSITKLSSVILLTCATSPWDFYSQQNIESPIALSSYPTISGWGTTRVNWSQLRNYIKSKPPILRCFITAVRHPKKALVLSFFLAAHIRVEKGILKAWDSPMALGMLIHNKKSWISDKTFIENVGRDSVASHTKKNDEHSEIFRQASYGKSRLKYSTSTRLMKKVDCLIENQAFNLRKRHLFSALKALIERKSDRA
jgi:hypothetical protein